MIMLLQSSKAMLYLFLIAVPAISQLSYVRPMDENIHYSQIVPFLDEWQKVFGDTEYKHAPSPINFWMKCVAGELRGYFHVEDLRKKPTHGKEASMDIAFKFRDRVKLYVEKTRIQYGIWMGGGDFKVDISHMPSNATAHIYVEDWNHYTIFPLSQCIAPPTAEQNKELKYVMTVYTRYFDNPHRLNKKATQGIANHFLYHRCALHLSHYELSVQAEQIPYFMKHPVLAEAAKQGYLTFYTKNSAIPPPIRNHQHGGSNCYWQAISQNLALLRRWKENARVYLWDGDEYMTYASDFKKNDFDQLVQKYPVLGFGRFMTFCYDCPNEGNDGELNYLSFNDRKYKKNDRLRDPKLMVDPSQAGCFIIHWSGCGPETHRVNESLAFVSHFENMYVKRFHKSKEELAKGEDLNEVYPVLKHCDPLKQSMSGPVNYYFN